MTTPTRDQQQAERLAQLLDDAQSHAQALADAPSDELTEALHTGSRTIRQHGALVAALREVADSLAETRDCALGNDPDGWGCRAERARPSGAG